MDPKIIPVVLFLVCGIIIVTFIYYRSKERQMLIEKGLNSDSIKEFYASKKNPFMLMKIGIISFFFGIGLFIGMFFEEYTGQEYWVPFGLFTLTGIGFIISNIVGRKFEKKDKEENPQDSLS